MNGPRPSTRAFLCDLPQLPADSKIRFLGCVSQYNVAVGHLILEHNYPRSKTGPNTVSVDINAVLESLTAEDLRVGTWLNVLGYVRDSSCPPEASFSSSEHDSQFSNSEYATVTIPVKVPARPVIVEALMVFPAGAIALGEYERILRNVQGVESRIHYSQ
ncbi:hypothetical protein N7478_013220 [Penicillium angulare]|uniref:uncharacterized protein n=1 Tax=Penicillium angulare TaxID=116970 RepID=UPI002540817B|nr:uncharacterized protein N7478_013220 [Penicillium angulare]KAJ5257116.1 hypothetical protein N7478_013220 [Penicillium angulare]